MLLCLVGFYVSFRAKELPLTAAKEFIQFLAGVGGLDMGQSGDNTPAHGNPKK